MLQELSKSPPHRARLIQIPVHFETTRDEAVLSTSQLKFPRKNSFTNRSAPNLAQNNQNTNFIPTTINPVKTYTINGIKSNNYFNPSLNQDKTPSLNFRFFAC